MHWPNFSIPHVFVIFSSLTSGDPPSYCKLYSHQEHRPIKKQVSVLGCFWWVRKGKYNLKNRPHCRSCHNKSTLWTDECCKFSKLIIRGICLKENEGTVCSSWRYKGKKSCLSAAFKQHHWILWNSINQHIIKS